MDSGHRLLWGLAGLGLCLACGPEVGDTPEGGKDEGSSGIGTGSTRPDQGSESGELPPVCESFNDDDASSTVGTTLELRNDSATSILLETNCGLDYLTLDNAAGWRWPAGFCADTCQGQFEFGCSACEGCAEGAFLVLGPGASIELDWGGELYETAMPPESCVGRYELCGEGSCPVLRAAAQGEELTVRVSAARQADCEAVAADPSACSCAQGMRCDTYVDATGLVPTAQFETTAVLGETAIIVEAVD